MMRMLQLSMPVIVNAMQSESRGVGASASELLPWLAKATKYAVRGHIILKEPGAQMSPCGTQSQGT